MGADFQNLAGRCGDAGERPQSPSDGDVAERPCIDPKRLQALERDGGAAFALGGHETVLEFGQAAGRKADDGQALHPFEAGRLISRLTPEAVFRLRLKP